LISKGDVMRAFRVAPLAVVAAFGVAFASGCGDEKTVADAATAAAAGPDPSGPELYQALLNRRNEFDE
jgi:hypothetical protein